MALEATIDLTVKKPDFKSMKSEIRELTVAAQQAVMQFGAFSPEAIKAEQALAGARDRMEDFNDRVKAVNPDKFAQINTVVQGAARGFQAAQGAMALFGSESEELQKTMVKLQGAMALAEGLEGLGKIQQQFTAIFTEVVSGAKKAFAAIKAGIGSTGIGLLVIALGSIVAYWDDIKFAIIGVSEETKKAKAEQDKYNQSMRDLNREREILLNGELAGKQTELNDILAEQNTLSARYVQIQKELKIIEQARMLTGIAADENRKQRLLAELKANELKGEKFINDEIKVRKSIRTLEDADQAKADATAKADADKAKAASSSKGAAIIKQNEQDKKHEQELQDSLSSIKGAGLFKQGEQLKTYTDAEYAVFAKAAADKKIINDNVTASAIQDELDVANAKNELVNASRDALSALGGLFKQGSAAAKTAALADIAIGTGLGFINALDIAQKGAKATGPAAPFAFPIFYASQIAAVLGAASRAKAILKGGSGGGGGGSAPVSPQGLPQVSAPNVSSSLPSVSGFDTKVFVTEGDIRRTQGRVDSLQKVSVVK